MAVTAGCSGGNNGGATVAYIRKFGVCRICFRGLALKGNSLGSLKSSW
ncbi:MAG: hypothetical protein ABR880_23235 [Candidatus Sulfotelmatobacter sp.]